MTQLFTTLIKILIYKEQVQDDLNRINKWCEVNNMALNKKKTKIMIFGKKSITKKLQNIEIHVGNFKLEQVSHFRYLGMTLDENLNFIQHINNMKKNVCHKIYLLRRFSKYMTDAVRLLIYKSHILPIIEYGDIIYMKSHKKHLDKLQRLQNLSLKICLNVHKRTSTNVIHKVSNLNLLHERRTHHLLNFLYSRTKINKYLDNDKQGPTLRSNTCNTLKVPTYRNNTAKNSIKYHGSIIWNNQDYEIKQIDTKLKYHRHLKYLYKDIRSNYQ